MKRNTDWNKVLDAIADAQARQNYRGYHGGAHHWSLDAEMPGEDIAQITAYMEAHGRSVMNLQSLMRIGFEDAGRRWKFNTRVAPLLVMFGGVACLGMIGALIDTNICLGFLIVFAILAFWFLKGYRRRRMKAVWKGGGSVSERLDKMCALSAKSSLGVRLVPLLVILVLALPLIVGTADPKLYPYLQAGQLAQQGEYDDAVKVYDKLGDYKDSREKKKETLIAQGDAYMAREMESLALEVYEEAGYAQGISAAHYALGEWYQAKDDFERAVSNFKAAGDYLDAQERTGKLYYDKAEQALADGDEIAAIEAFAGAGEYSDAQERIAGIYRANAGEYLTAGEDELAAHQFMLAGDTRRAEDIYARLIADAVAGHDYDTAARIHTVLGDSESAQYMRYLEAVWNYDAGRYGYAYLCFSAMPDYVPAEGRSVSDYLADEKIIADAEDTLWYQPGSIVVFGFYEQDNDRSNGAEPLEWIVLDSDGSKSLLMTRYVIDHVHNDMSELYWVNSQSREWLNSEFFEAFTPEEQDAILTTKVYNGVETSHPETGRPGGEDTEDRIFLLSYQEALQYLGTREAPVATDYARKQGVNMAFGSCDSLLRSVAYTEYMEKELGMAISDDGRIVQHSGGFKPEATGLQPVMWVDLSKTINAD